MTVNDSSPAPEWINQLRRDFEALRQEFSLQQDHLGELTVGDFTHIFDAASRFEEMLGTDQALQQQSRSDECINGAARLHGNVARGYRSLTLTASTAYSASLLESVQAAYEGEQRPLCRSRPGHSIRSRFYPGGR